MGRRRPRSASRGRRTLLDAETHAELVRRTQAGAPMELAAESAGVAARTFVLWLARGREEEERLADTPEGQEPAPEESEERYLALWRDVRQARANAAVRNVAHVQKAAAGGTVTEETVKKYRDPETGEMVEERTVKRQPPDWRAAAWYLEKQARVHFGKQADQVEVSGPGGGPLEVEVQVSAEDLAARVASNVAALSAANQAAIGPGEDDTVDAEVVDDPGSSPSAGVSDTT